MMVSWASPEPAARQTDADYLLDLLRDGRELTGAEILRYSQHERGVGMTIHSRAAELRGRGHDIQCRCLGRKNGRSIYAYKLVALREPEVPPACENSGSRSANHAPLTGTTEALQDGSSPFPSEESAPVVPAPQLSLDLPGSTYRKDVAA